MGPEDTGKVDMTLDGTSESQMNDFSTFSEQKSSFLRGLGERLAARTGFNAPKLNTEKIRSSDLPVNLDIQSSYLTRPPGLSPTTLLESPVFLPSSLAQASPTTGKFPSVLNNENKCSKLLSEAYDKSKDFGNLKSPSFSFKTAAESGSLFVNQTSKTAPGSLPWQSFPSMTVHIQSNWPQIMKPAENISRSSAEGETGINITTADPRVLDAPDRSNENSPPLDEQQDEGNQICSVDMTDAGAGGTQSEDRYNWRKYGQKQVKGSEHPRSYYKCTHPNCQVKKKVERSQEGHITEIIYKGEHNHPTPPPNRRLAIGSSSPLDFQLDFPDQGRHQSGADGDLAWENMKKKNASEASEGRHENTEVTSSASVAPELCNPSSSLQPQSRNQIESVDAVDASATFSNDEDEHDVGTLGTMSLPYDGEEDESDSKRRKVEAYATDMSGASRAIREPRVVVQTTSEVDILDDGYRWRKYGQKVVKGNPNPRSYYKCTSAGCNVRKHVERASHDLKSVITTYEGKHNHDVPVARNSSHVNSAAAAQMNSASVAGVESQVYRCEPSQVRNSMASFENLVSLNSFGMHSRPQPGPNPGFAFGMMNQPRLSNVTMSGLGSSQGKMPALPVHPFLAQCSVNNTGFMLPKDESKPESMPGPALKLSFNSPNYQQILGRLPPLGP